MDTKPSKEFVPHSGGKKRKKKKKKKRKSQQEPEDPHYTKSKSRQPHSKSKQKHKRKTNFEVDDVAPTIKMSGGYERLNTSSSFSNSIKKRSRKPKGTRTAVRKGGNDDIDHDIHTLEAHYKQFARKSNAPRVLEDKSGDEEEKEDKENCMDIDNDCDNDPWNNDNDLEYTPITLKRKASYAKNGVIAQNVMFDVFKETQEYGNNFIFIQMPPILPLVSHLNEDEKRDLENFKKIETSLLRQMGEGEIGKVRIRKSGKTELVIGDYVMDAKFAAPMDCYQQVMHIHCENTADGQIKGKSQFLGHVPAQNNLVCSYKAEDLLL